jgi:putative transposase
MPVVKLTSQIREQLQAITRSRTLSQAMAQRARIILLAADGLSNGSISQQLHLSRQTVGKWRKRFIRQSLLGLYDEPKSGAPRSMGDEQIAELVHRTLKSTPANATHWSCRSLAQESQVSKSSVQRVWRAFGLKPHRQKHFTLSTDPFFVEKVRDIVGLYLNPPDNAMVLCVDEKSQIQALDRTQPVLPMGLGYVEGVTHHYVRHGTTTLFAALDIASGEVLSKCKPRHRHQEFLQFLEHIDANVPPELEIHLVVDNYATHKHEKVRRWLAARRRYHIHYTPTSASWLNQVEIWFNIITQRAIRRGTFRKVKELIARIEDFVRHYNVDCQPFAWVATADSILQKVNRLCQYISGTQH